MLDKAQSRPDLLLLLSLLLVILMYPVLDHGDVRRLVLGGLMFLPVFIATLRLSKIKGWVAPAVLLMVAAFIVSLVSDFVPTPALIGTKWGLLTVFFGVTVVGLFSYLKNARSVTDAHLYTAASIYLLLGIQWFTLYSAIDVFYPGSILYSSATVTDRSSELLYFSLITLSTIGYGDIVPLHGEVRMLAALEGITGVLYVAITVALLVSAYKQRAPE
ncbi:MAG: ion channel [Acidobacteriota bacterium]|nr:ion channel [Acidobacteriota bacterium]